MGKRMRHKGQKPNREETQLYDKITKIQAEILRRIQKLKQLPKFTYCHHLILEKGEAEPFDSNINYYDRYWKRFLINEIGKAEITKLQDQIACLSKRLERVESLFTERVQQLKPFHKYRTKGYKIQELTQYTCKICSRSYGDRQTLILHQQIKHSGKDENQQKKEKGEEIYEQDQANSQNNS